MAQVLGFEDIQVGDTIYFMIPAGIGRNGLEWTEKRGRVVMHGTFGWVCNGGGRHGTPYVVNEKNFQRLGRRGK